MEHVDASVGSWIRPRLTGRWGSVTGVVPAGYDAYVRILHPVDSATHLLRWSDVAKLTGRQMHPLVQWWRLIGADKPLNPVSTLWGGSAPTTGEMMVPAANAMLATLAEHTATPNVTYFGFWTGYAGNNGTHTWIGADQDLRADARPDELSASPPHELELPGRRYGLLQGSLDAARHIVAYLDQHETGPTSPNVMWPNDRQWYAAAEIDFDSTLVACSTDAARALASHEGLEAYTVATTDSLQFDADTINT